MTLQPRYNYQFLINLVRDFAASPSITFLLQVAVLATAAASVEVADWVESPSLVLIASLAALAAAILNRFSRHSKASHVSGILSGASIAYLVGLYLTNAETWYLKFGTLHSRLALWWSAVTGEDATTDTLPLTMALVTITWTTSYFTSWGLFRYRNPWITLLPIGAGTLINLTYLPEQFSVYLFVFLFFGLLLLVHMTCLRHSSRLRADGIPHPPSLHLLSIAQGLTLSIITLGVTTVIPMSESPAAPLKVVFAPVSRSLENIRGDLHRIFAAVPGNNLDSLRFFGSVLPLLRPVPTGEDVILSSNSRLPLYWPAIAYDQYTSKAWKVEDTRSRPMVSLLDEEYQEDGGALILGDASIAYGVHMYVGSPYLLIAGEPVDIIPAAEQEIHTGKSFSLDLADSEANKDLPLDLQVLASALASSLTSSNLTHSVNTPSGLVVTKVVTELSPSGRDKTTNIKRNSPTYYSDLQRAISSQGTIKSMEVARLPQGDSAISYRPIERLKSGSEYSIVSALDTASEEALRSSSGEYPPGILDLYLQIPETLPYRVSELASTITSNSFNAYDKATAVETYLRDMKYTVASSPIPYNADSVDHFLFESHEGYSDYFASAMAVMLRTQGIPTRLVLGFGPGEEHPEEEGFLVRDKDSHSWPEVYFPQTGWIAFEPTPIYERRTRGRPESIFGFAGLFDKESTGEDFDSHDGLLQPEDEREKRDDFGGPLPGGEGPRALPKRYFGTPLGTGGALFVLFLVIGIVALRILWIRQYGILRSPNLAYERMHSLATFLGAPSNPSETAFEFSRNLSRLIPNVDTDVTLVSNTFVRQRYGAIRPSSVDELRLIWAWRRIKRALLAQLSQTNEPSISAG